MEIKDFEVEQWMNLWETKCTYNEIGRAHV